jgi:hypothetical protein
MKSLSRELKEHLAIAFVGAIIIAGLAFAFIGPPEENPTILSLTERQRPVHPIPPPCVWFKEVELQVPVNTEGLSQFEIEWADGVGTWLWREAATGFVMVPVRANSKCEYLPVRIKELNPVTGVTSWGWTTYDKIEDGRLVRAE